MFAQYLQSVCLSQVGVIPNRATATRRITHTVLYDISAGLYFLCMSASSLCVRESEDFSLLTDKPNRKCF